jgi:DNA modification methylase
VWTIPTQPYRGAHFATFPEKLVEPCIKAGCPEGGIVLDPFLGSGTTICVAYRLGREWVGIEINEKYIDLAWKRIGKI